MKTALFKEPLLHFAIAGAVLFVGYSVLNRDNPGPSITAPIHIDDGEVRWLQETFASQWQRPPSETELFALIDGLVEEELLAREAVTLGLDQDDTIVRRRLAQKMAFLIDDSARVAEPADAELRAYYATKANSFLAPAHVSFQQIYFSPNHRPDAASDARAALAAIPVAADPAAIGDPIALEPEFLDLDRQAVAGLFGEGFADAVFKLAPGTWAGPVNSAYGLHLVQVTAVTPPASPPFEAVRTKVLEEWRHEKEAAAKSAYLASLREKYGVIIDAEIEALPLPTAEPTR